jgi:hypothetical protein
MSVTVQYFIALLQAVKIFDRQLLSRRKGFGGSRRPTLHAGASTEPLTARPPDALDNVRREIAIMKQLTHPNVIKVRHMH